MDEDDLTCLQDSVQVKPIPQSTKLNVSNRSPGSLPVPRRLVTTALYMSVIPLLLTLVCILRWLFLAWKLILVVFLCFCVDSQRVIVLVLVSVFVLFIFI